MAKKEVQLEMNDDGLIVEPNETLEITKVSYENLDKVDLIRLCKEKDNHIQSYEAERNTTKDYYNTQIKDLNEYYSKKLKEHKAIISYYERKFELIKNLIDIEKETKKDDSI